MERPGLPILQVIDLVKHYPGVTAVNGVSFSVARGTCFGLLGPNGAGKTTAVEIMEGIISPSSGQVLYKGASLGPRFRAEAGIQFQKTALQDYLTVKETLVLFQSLYETAVPIHELADLCELNLFLDRDTRKLSGGQRQRLLVAIALVNHPQVLFLDEPTTGLDPQSRRNFWDLIELIKRRNKTVLLTTHYMEEAYKLCDEIAIMDTGKIIAQGAPDALLKEHFSDTVLHLRLSDLSTASEQLTLPITVAGTSVEIRARDIDQTIKHLIACGISLANLRIRPHTLDDLFLELTGKELRS